MATSIRVMVAPDAVMAFPSSDLCWKMRYVEPHDYAAAASLESFRYLVLECNQKEAWRRIKLIRNAARKEK